MENQLVLKRDTIYIKKPRSNAYQVPCNIPLLRSPLSSSSFTHLWLVYSSEKMGVYKESNAMRDMRDCYAANVQIIGTNWGINANVSNWIYLTTIYLTSPTWKNIKLTKDILLNCISSDRLSLNVCSPSIYYLRSDTCCRLDCPSRVSVLLSEDSFFIHPHPLPAM